MSNPAPTSVLVVDDHPLWRDAVARDLTDHGYDVRGRAGSVTEATVVAAATLPDVVLMDMNLPDGTGAMATAHVLVVSPRSRVLVVSASDEKDDVVGALRAGALGYLVKSASAAELIAAVDATARGDAVFTPGLAGLVLGEFRRPRTGLPELTPRETEVLRMVATGLSSKQIAARLTLSPRTVDNHVGNTLRKLQLNNRVELARYAIDHGLDGEDPAV